MKKYTLVDLTHEVHPEIPTWDMTCGYFVKTMRDYQHCDGEYKFRSQALDIRASAGTHIDAPSHCFAGTDDVSDISLEKLVVPCIMVDVSSRADQKYKVSVADIQAFEAQYGKIPAGSFVLFYTGWSKHWDTPKKYHNNLQFPSISGDVARLLLDRDIVGLGIDTLSPDCDEKGSFVHAAILGAGKYIIENIASNAEKLPPVGAEILVMPLRVQGAAESPIRLIARIAE
jgi:kynurenine formamidase